MHRTLIRAAGILSFACISIGIVQAAYAPGPNLYINGALASSRVFQHDGMACVPVADVAKALNLMVFPKADGYSITRGGADPVAGLNGKIGDKLTDGDQTVTVVKAFRTDKYESQFFSGKTITPDGANDDVVVVVFRMKNMLNKRLEVFPPHGDKTALTDQNSHVYTSVYTDSHDTLATMLPGSASDFALCFSMPKSEKVGDMIFQVFSYGGSKPSIFRISLTSINP